MCKTANVKYFKKYHNWNGDARSLVQKLVSDIFTEVDNPPIDVYKRLKIISSYRDIHPNPILKDLGDDSACIMQVNNRNTIFLNENHSEGRRLFSWAHEIIHTFFPAKPISKKIDGHWIEGENPEEEALCDFGASKIIFWNTKIKTKDFDESLLQEIVEKTGASLEASAIFMAKSEVYRYGMALWSLKYKKGQCSSQQSFLTESPIQPKFRIEYAIYSNGIFLPKNKSINEGEELIKSTNEKNITQKGVIKLDLGTSGLYSFSTIAISVNDGKVLTLLKQCT